MTLTAEQQAVVRQTGGPLLVLAPVGSGKTRVLAERLQAALAEGRTPSRCLCLTFTNRAARELRERLASLGVAPAQGDTAGPLLTTFHSFCARFLRREAGHAGLRSDFSIYDEEDCGEERGGASDDHGNLGGSGGSVEGTVPATCTPR